MDNFTGELSPYDTVNAIEGIWIEIDQTTLTPSGAEIITHNTTERNDLFRGLSYCIEKYRKGNWYTFAPLPDITFGAPSLDIHIPTASEIEAGFVDGLHYYSDSEFSWARYPPNRIGCKWEYDYGVLPSGDYRIIIDLISYDDIPLTENSPVYYLSAQFSIHS